MYFFITIIHSQVKNVGLQTLKEPSECTSLPRKPLVNGSFYGSAIVKSQNKPFLVPRGAVSAKNVGKACSVQARPFGLKLNLPKRLTLQPNATFAGHLKSSREKQTLPGKF